MHSRIINRDLSEFTSQPFYCEDQLWYGDWFNLYTRINTKSVNLLLTSPPWGTLDKQPWDRAVDLNKLSASFDFVLKDNGLIIIHCALKQIEEVLVAFSEHFKQRSYHIWRKSLAQPINDVMPLPDADHLLVLKRKGCRTKDTIWNQWEGMPSAASYEKHSNILDCPTRRHKKSAVSKNEDGSRWIKTVLDGPTKCNMLKEERTSHPTQLPETLLRTLIRTYTDENSLAVDSFAGSGSTVLSAIKEGRRALGVELNEMYYKEALIRIKRATSQLGIFTDSAKNSIVNNPSIALC